MLTDEEMTFLRQRLEEDESHARATLRPGGPAWPEVGRGERIPEMAHIERHGPARVLREVSVWRRLLLDYQTTPLDAAYGGTERETGFRLALSAALKAKIATYEGNPVTGEPFPSDKARG